MKRLNVVTKDNYKRKVILTSIILCWVILLACFVVKLFGGNFFNVVCNNNAFIKVCQWIDKTPILFYTVQGLAYIFGTYLFILGGSKNSNSTKSKIILLLITVLLYALKRLLLFVNPYIATTVEALVIIITPIIFKTKWWKSILLYGLMNVFALISTFTKNIGGLIIPDYSLLGLIMLIDYYIMIVLFYLYSIHLKRRSIMGGWGIAWFHKEISKYEAVKKSNLEKIAKLEKENAEIDTKIAELKAKENENK